MKIRERLLAHLREAQYRPQGEADLAHSLGLPKKQRAMLAAELSKLLSSGEVITHKGKRYKLAKQASKQPAKQSPKRSSEITGTIRFRAAGSAFIIRDDLPADQPEQTNIQISPDDTDVAFHGDRVAIKIRPGVRTRREGEVAGRVLRVIERGRDTMVGNLRKSGCHWLVVPDDPRFNFEVLVKDPASSSLKPAPIAGDKVVVQLDEWRDRRDSLTGTLTSRLGRTHEPRAEILGVFEKYGLDPNFPANVEREAAEIPSHVLPAQMRGRLDYREVPTRPIEPDDAKEFDDAISIEELEDGETRVGIHIADVSAYVKAESPLDREAQRRGNSTYLVGTVIPMLPEKLSNGLCSLVEGENRLTKAVFLLFGKHGKLKERTFGNTVIRSRKRLTYKQAYAFLFEDDLTKIKSMPLPPKHQTGSTGRAINRMSLDELSDIQKWVRRLWNLASGLRKARMNKGSLDLDMPETKIFVDPEGYADRLELIENDESHQLIEEFMLAANESVAQLTKRYKLPSIYRVHDEPDDEKLAELRKLLATHGIKVGDLTNRQEAVKLLLILRGHPQGYTLRTQFLRSLKKACYRSSHDGHYGLHKSDYSHFTSPIRRYADLVVHRVFDRYLIQHAGYPAHHEKRSHYDKARAEKIAEHLSLTEINSQDAERDSVKIKLLEFFERELTKKPPTIFPAIITDIRAHGFFIELEESMTFGLVPASLLSDDHYTLSNDGSSMVGRKTKCRYSINDHIEVIVAKVDRFKRLIDFTIASDFKAPPRKGDRSPQFQKPLRKSKPASAKKSGQRAEKNFGKKSGKPGKPFSKKGKGSNSGSNKAAAPREKFVPQRLRK